MFNCKFFGVVEDCKRHTKAGKDGSPSRSFYFLKLRNYDTFKEVDFLLPGDADVSNLTKGVEIELLGTLSKENRQMNFQYDTYKVIENKQIKGA